MASDQCFSGKEPNDALPWGFSRNPDTFRLNREWVNCSAVLYVPPLMIGWPADLGLTRAIHFFVLE